jgi:tetratricopeptide (TPR) repeat protein
LPARGWCDAVTAKVLRAGSLLLMYGALSGGAFAQQANAPKVNAVAESPELAAAKALFAQGKYLEAEAATNKLPDSDKYGVAGNLLRGRIALSANQLAVAQGLFAQAQRLDSKNVAAAALLGEAYARQQRWMDAAAFYDHGKKNALALQAQDVAASMPYQPFHIDGLGALDRIPLMHAQWPAVLGVRIDTGEVVNFAVDLNADQLVVDAAYAKQLGLKTIVDMDLVIAEALRPDGAKFDRVTYSTIGELAIGAWVVRDLPVTMRSLSGNSAGGDGLIGAGVLRNFLVTLDVPRGQIWLRRPDDAAAAAALKQATASAVKTVVVRFTPAGALVHADGTPLEDTLWQQGAVTMDFKNMVLLVSK